MASIKDRSEENKSRKLRQAKLERGPGVFVYDGGAFDTAAIPTYLKVGREVPAFDANSMPVVDAAGRQVYERAGALVRDAKGQPVLGGVPELRHIELDVVVVRGVSFPRGEAVEVPDDSLALKLRGMDGFREIEPGEEPVPKKRGRKPKGDREGGGAVEVGDHEIGGNGAPKLPWPRDNY